MQTTAVNFSVALTTSGIHVPGRVSFGAIGAQAIEEAAELFHQCKRAWIASPGGTTSVATSADVAAAELFKTEVNVGHACANGGLVEAAILPKVLAALPAAPAPAIPQPMQAQLDRIEAMQDRIEAMHKRTEAKIDNQSIRRHNIKQWTAGAHIALRSLHKEVAANPAEAPAGRPVAAVGDRPLQGATEALPAIFSTKTFEDMTTHSPLDALHWFYNDPRLARHGEDGTERLLTTRHTARAVCFFTDDCADD